MAQDQFSGESVAEIAASGDTTEIADRALTADKLGGSAESLAEAAVFDLKVEF